MLNRFLYIIHHQLGYIFTPLIYFVAIFVLYKISKRITTHCIVYDKVNNTKRFRPIVLYIIAVICCLIFSAIVSNMLMVIFLRIFVNTIVPVFFGITLGTDKAKSMRKGDLIDYDG